MTQLPTFNARTRLKLLLGGAASFGLSACGREALGPETQTISSLVIPPVMPQPIPFTLSEGQVRSAFVGRFEIGAAVQAAQITRDTSDRRILASQFNSITAEYEMKAATIAPSEGVYDWTAADALVAFAQANNMRVRGHALLWHESTPAWFLTGTPAQVRTKLETYITAVVTRYRGQVYAWDVVNEVITDDDNAADPYRRSVWWEASGGNADYIDWAFEAARAADPDCALFINDYATEQADKLSRYLEVITDLVARGIALDGVGHQFHLNINTDATTVARALDAVDAQFMGLDQHVTELDVSLYDDPGSCWNAGTGCDRDFRGFAPDAVIRAQARLYRAVFAGFAARPSVKSVSTWGVSDGQSWLNTLPVTRTNAPLLWDRAGAPKPALRAVLDPNYLI